MPTYSFQMSAGLAGSSVSVTATGSATVVASGTLDTNAKFTASLPVGDYVAKAADGHYSYSSAGTVTQPDADQLVDLNATYARSYGQRAVVIGDSITATTNDSTARLWNDSWFLHFCLASGGRVFHVRNSGVGGNTTAQMLARFDADVLAYDPDVVFIAGGTNNLADADPMGRTAADITAMVAKVLGANAKPILCTIPPAGSAALGTPTAAPTVTGFTTGGTLAAGTYQYAYTRLTAAGETPRSPGASVTTTGTTSSVRVVPPADKGVTGYKVYRSADGGTTWGLISTVGFASTSSWCPKQIVTDTGAAAGAAPPATDTTARALTTGDRTNISKINAWLRKYASDNRLDLIDNYGAVVDPATGMYQTGYSHDGTHPTPQASRIMGQAAWDALKALWSNTPVALAQENGDPINILANGLLMNGSSSLPTSWASYNGDATGYTDTLAARTGFLGKALTISRTDPTSRLHNAPQFSTGYAVGDRLAFAGVVETLNVEEANAVINIQAYLAGTAPTQYIGSLQLSANTGKPAPFYFEAVVPTGTTGIRVDAHISNAAQSASASVGQLTVRNLTAIGLA